MNLCIITSDPDFGDDERSAFLDRLTNRCSCRESDRIFVLGYRWRTIPREGTMFHLLWGQDSFRQKIYRQLFCALEGSRGWPSSLAAILLRLCRRKICENVLACDPDIVLFDDSSSGAVLEKMLREHYPHWQYATQVPAGGMPNIESRIHDEDRKISIILPTYNGAKYIRRSIESCIKQTYGNIELIVVDDGSSAPMERIVREFPDRRIKYLRHSKNLGLAAALNTGFRECTGDYLTWTSDDNAYAADAMERMGRFLQTCTDVDFVYASQYIMDEAGKVLKVLTARPPQWLSVNNGVGGCFLYRRAVYESVGDYNGRAFLAEDYDYWLRVRQSFRMQRLFVPLYYYRRHRDSLTEKYGAEQVATQAAAVKTIYPN